MQHSPNECMTLLYWDKTTWYALGALSSSLQRYNLPYKIIRRDPLPQIQSLLDRGLHVVYGESARITTIDALKERLKRLKARKVYVTRVQIIPAVRPLPSRPWPNSGSRLTKAISLFWHIPARSLALYQDAFYRPSKISTLTRVCLTVISFSNPSMN